MIQFATFPRTWSPPEWVDRMMAIFRRHESAIGTDRPQGKLSSEEVLAILAGDLEGAGFHIEKMKLGDRTAPSPPDTPDPAAAGEPLPEHYHFDVYHPEWHCCVAIEDGPVWTNDAIDADAVEPLLVANADTLCLAVPGSNPSVAGRLVDSEYERAVTLAKAVYHRSRPYLPHRLVLIGY
jgi:hypothetical protein